MISNSFDDAQRGWERGREFMAEPFQQAFHLPWTTCSFTFSMEKQQARSTNINHVHCSSRTVIHTAAYNSEANAEQYLIKYNNLVVKITTKLMHCTASQLVNTIPKRNLNEVQNELTMCNTWLTQRRRKKTSRSEYDPALMLVLSSVIPNKTNINESMITNTNVWMFIYATKS